MARKSTKMVLLGLKGLTMKSFDAYVRSGAMQKAVNSAVRQAAVDAQARGLPPAGPAKLPAFVAAALVRPPIKPVPALVR